MMRRCALLALIAGSHVVAQTIPYGFNNMRWDGPAASDLVPTHGGRSGRIAYSQTSEGLWIFGRITGGAPKYAQFPAEMGTREYVSVWLALTQHVAMPKLAWGSQFGMTSCQENAGLPGFDLAGCRAWEARQLAYREKLGRLFLRHWQLSPGVSVETGATAAYGEALQLMTNWDRRSLTKLSPHGEPEMSSCNMPAFSDFRVLIRWSDFPPANTLEVSKIYLSVDLSGPGQARSSTSQVKIDGNLTRLTGFSLERPMVSTVSRCGESLDAVAPFSDPYPAWYFLDSRPDVVDTFSLQTFVRGYQYTPEGLSPIVTWSHRFSIPVGQGVVCGPDLRYVSGGRTFVKARDEVNGNTLNVVQTVYEQGLVSQPLPDGSYLLKSGPNLGTKSPLGTGRCGACPKADLALYHLSPTEGISIAFSQTMILDPPQSSDGDIRVSEDWQTVTVYRAQQDPASGTESWSFERYCLMGVKYRMCGGGESIPPSNPRSIVWSREKE